MNTLAWALVHFLWQGFAIAALAAAAMFVFRRPATRYAIGVSALGLMLLSFAVTYTLLGGARAIELPARAAAAAVVLPLEGFAGPMSWTGEPVAGETVAGFAWIARGWLFGVCALGLRIAFGLLLIEHLRRRNLVALPDALVARFERLQARLGLTRRVQYAECPRIDVPAVIGFFRPVVLLPMRALTGLSPEQLDAVIAHELGHVKRFDVAVNFVQVVTETLFFFHPAVWWLNKRIRADREDCCDDIAVAVTGGKLGYARALATIEGWRGVPDFAMAATGGSVSSRVARLLGMNPQDPATRHAGVVTATLVLLGALLAGAISLALARPANAQEREAEIAEPISPAPAPAPVPVRTAVPAMPPVKAQAVLAAMPAPAVAVKPATNAKPAPAAPAAPTRQGESSYIAEMRREVGELTVDELIAMKVQDVSPEYVRELRAMGFNPSTGEIIALKTQDVSPEYVNAMRALDIKFDTGQLIALKTMDVTPEYVKQLRAQGFTPDVDELVAMRSMDVTPEFRKLMQDAGFKLSVSELIQARAMDVTPEFIARVREHGFKDLSFQQIIQLKNADVL